MCRILADILARTPFLQNEMTGPMTDGTENEKKYDMYSDSRQRP